MSVPLLYGAEYYVPPEISVEVYQSITKVNVAYIPNITLTSKFTRPDVTLDQTFHEVHISDLTLVSSVDVVHTEVASIELKGVA
jgi:hypothetical protein